MPQPMGTEGPLRISTSRVVVPAPDIRQLSPIRPSIKTMSTREANSDNVLSTPLGYQCKAVTLVAPDGSFKSGGGANTDSIYLDVEDQPTSDKGTPTGNNGPHELPAGKSLTIEECDPGWIHFSSPTANQRLMVSWGGPSH